MEPEHGGGAVREYYISGDIGWYSKKSLWKGLESFGIGGGGGYHTTYLLRDKNGDELTDLLEYTLSNLGRN